VRVTEDELERVKKTAEHYGMSVSELVRKALGL
jgi:predicted DNA binding CopG/RHH family protein